MAASDANALEQNIQEKDKEAIFSWLKNNGLLASGINCGHCALVMNWRVYNRNRNGFVW